MQRLPGFRDFYPEDCAFRNYLFETWRKVARSFGFVEYDGPTLEPTDLYKKKSGEELKTQLFRFVDQGERDVCLRPEMTPTLARLVAARERDFRKPLKWFSISTFFRFEKPQKGRLREFYQINCDIIGDKSVAADAELIALGVALHEAFGLTSSDFFVRLSNRFLWNEFLTRQEVSPDRLPEFLAIVDKLGRDSKESSERKLKAFGLPPEALRDFLETPVDTLPGFGELLRQLKWRGIEKYIELDLTVVRGLDYYTGLVFEFFDRKKENRSLAGGGRYDNLLSTISDGVVDLPAAGFAIGDVTFGNLLCECEHTKLRIDQALGNRLAAYIVVADETRREMAIQLADSLRRSGISVDYALGPTKVGKQFQLAETLGAAKAVVVGQEWPQLRVKRLSDRTEQLIAQEEIHAILAGV